MNIENRGVEPEVLEQLFRKIPYKQRQGGRGMMFDYLDARQVMDLLDEVVGQENWQRKHSQESNTYYCEIGILIKGIGWVWKGDGGSESNTEAEKGGASSAFKRAAVSWGIGRFLYPAKKGDKPENYRRPKLPHEARIHGLKMVQELITQLVSKDESFNPSNMIEKYLGLAKLPSTDTNEAQHVDLLSLRKLHAALNARLIDTKVKTKV